MRLRAFIIIMLFCFYKTNAQLLYFQDNFRGGICVDGKSYPGMDYLNADTIVFINSVPAGATIKKAFLISERLNNYVAGSTPLADIPLTVLYNNNPLVLDSTAIVTNIHYCSISSTGEGLYVMVKDVTTLTINNNNSIQIPCQGCTVKAGQAVYAGFLLVILYENLSMPTTNTAIFLNTQSYNSFGMNYALGGLNPINTTKDVAIAFEGENIGDSIKLILNGNYLGPLFATQYMIDNNNLSKAPGSFYYQNNTAFGLVDDTPNGTVDSSDALINGSSYIINNSVSCNLAVSLKANPACEDILNTFIFAYSTPCPARSISPVQSFSLCNGQNLQLNATAGATTYSWFPSSGLSGNTIANPVASPTLGTYNYIVQVDSSGCKHTEHITVSVFPSPKFDSVSVSNAVCGGNLGAVTIAPSHGGTTPYSYDIGGVAQNGTYFYPLNPNTYTATVTDARGCKYKKSFTIAEINLANVNFTFPNPVCIGGLTTFTNTSTNVNNLNWYINATLFSSLSGNISYTFTDTLAYNITLIGWSNLPQCSDTAVKTVYVKECPSDSIKINLPNVFTPNADGINDTWHPLISIYGFTIDNYELLIYDRWGLKVFEGAEINQGWDGHTTSGMECTVGTYFYVIKYTATGKQGENKQETLKGFLQLSR